MELIVSAIGRLKKGPEQDLVSRYLDRAAKSGRSLGFSGPTHLEHPESRAQTSAQRKQQEAQTLLQKVSDGARLIAFDERGKSISSQDFANHLANWRDNGAGACAMVIGGPDGLDHDLRDRADLVLSFGKLTMPHQLARVLVLEQVYRAITILSGHPYHRE